MHEVREKKEGVKMKDNYVVEVEKIHADPAGYMKRLRSYTGLTQKDFAEKYHIPLPTIRCWEQGQRVAPEYVYFLLEQVIKQGK